MGTTVDGEQTFPPAKAVIINELIVRVEDENVYYAYNPALLITTNGQVWEVLVNAFVAREEVVFKMWNETPELFTRRQAIPIE